MSTPGEEPQERPTPLPGSYGEIAPGVPRYGQYAPAGWEPPQEVKDAQNASRPTQNIPPAVSYPGFGGAQAGTSSGPLPHLAPPSQVSTAVRLITLAGIMQALSVVALMVVLLVPAAKAAVLQVLLDAMAGTPGVEELYSDPTVVNTVLFLALVLSLAMAVTYFWLAREIRRGSGWARTTALVLGGLSLVFLAQANPLVIVQVALGLVGVFLLYRTPAKEFFLEHKGRREALKR